MVIRQWMCMLRSQSGKSASSRGKPGKTSSRLISLEPEECPTPGSRGRAPDYAPARRKRRVEGLVQPLLFDFPREEKVVGSNKIGPASSPRSYLHVIPSPSDDN